MSSSAGALTQAVRTEPEYELTESTYAVPNAYEYTTLGPNEQAVTLTKFSNLSIIPVSYLKPATQAKLCQLQFSFCAINEAKINWFVLWKSFVEYLDI